MYALMHKLNTTFDIISWYSANQNVVCTTMNIKCMHFMVTAASAIVRNTTTGRHMFRRKLCRR